MSTRNFYNAMTPGSSLSEEMMFGKSAYKQITNSELNSNFIVNMNKLPVNGSNLLNAINEHGLLSYTDFHFLLLLMSTPTRYLDIIFHGFDISADGSVEAKVTISLPLPQQIHPCRCHFLSLSIKTIFSSGVHPRAGPNCQCEDRSRRIDGAR